MISGMWKRFAFSVCLAALLPGDCIQVPEIQQGRVRVVATDQTGAPISDVHVEFKSASSGVTIEANSEDLLILYGDYRLRVTAKGFISAQREVGLYQPETVVRIELAVGRIGCPDPPARSSSSRA